MNAVSKSIPLPVNAGQRGRAKKYNFEDLKEHGDSLFFALEDNRGIADLRAAIVASHRIRGFNSEFKLTTRKDVVGGKVGVRIWRMDNDA
jgi:hypothetical protein